jgi:hypothetical protein
MIAALYCFATGRHIMIEKLKLALFAADAAASVGSRASAGSIRDYGSLLLTTARRLYDAHLERAQMRLAPTHCAETIRRSMCAGRD